MLFYNKRYIKQYTYVTLTKPTVVTPEFLALVKEHLRYAYTGDNEDDYLTLLINIAYNYAEQYTKRTLLTTEFKTFRDTFQDCCFVLRRSPAQSVTLIQYVEDNIWKTVPDTDYYVTQEQFFARILRTKDAKWDYKNDPRQQSIEITFNAGYGDVYTDIPSDLLMGLLQHISKLFESRGDCDDAACSAALPAQAKMIYDKYKIVDLIGQTDCGCLYGNYYNRWFYG